MEVLAEKGTEPTHVSEEHTELEDRAGGLWASPLDSTLDTITCQESIELNMYLSSKISVASVVSLDKCLPLKLPRKLYPRVNYTLGG